MGKFRSGNRLLIRSKQRLIKKTIYQTLRNSRTYEDIYTGAHYKVLRALPFHMRTTEAAVKLLKERYGNKQLIISTYMNNLIKLDKVMIKLKIMCDHC